MIQVYSRSLFLIITTCLILFSACKEAEKAPEPKFDTGAMLQNIGNEVILPYYDSLKISTGLLEIAVNKFAAAPDEAKLLVAQNAWQSVSKCWAKAEFIKLGPADLEMLLDVNINYWPTDVKTIESNITNSRLTGGTNSKGLAALEYLLFSKNINNAELINLYNSTTNGESRKIYVKEVAKNIALLSNQIYTAWLPGGGNYLRTFVSATGSDINSSTGLLVNVLVFQLEVLINKKIGVPIGKIGTPNVNPNAVQANLSNYSKEIMLANLDVLEMLFKGKDGIGLDDYLDFVKADYYGTPLSSTIKYRIAEMRKNILLMSEPLSESLANSTEQAGVTWTSGKKLLTVMKVDMSSRLGVSITFSSNDGD